MKTIGLLGGMSWHSSLEYYRLINELIQERLGGVHSARCLLYSVEFAEIDALERENCWGDTASILITAAQPLERGSADFVVICSTTTHKNAEQIQSQIGIPILHIADATAHHIYANGLHLIGLLGTRFTMEEDFIRGKLEREYGLEVIIPALLDREIVHRVIYEEFCAGLFLEQSRAQYMDIMKRLIEAGAKGIILGCTEIGLLVRPKDCQVPLFDTTRIHRWIMRWQSNRHSCFHAAILIWS
jgi:aspartate racemase